MSSAAAATGETAPPTLTLGSRRFPFWSTTVVLIVSIKLLVFALDSQPMFFLGDSGSYIQTALSGWAPPDRSFVYGYFIWLVTAWSASLSSLVFAQALLSAATACMVTLICLKFIEAGPGVSLSAGVVVALEPLQLLYERFVMTEALSTAVYVAILFLSCVYLKRRTVAPLFGVAVLAVLAVTLRLSFLLVVNVSAVLLCLLPLLGFRREGRSIRDTQQWKRIALHVVLILTLLLLLEDGYKRLNGYKVGAEPAFQYEDGLFLISAWAPILQPEDAPTPEVAAVIAKGSEYFLREPSARNAHHYADGLLVSRLSEVVKSDFNKFCKRLALSSALRHPFALVKLGGQTLASYLDLRQLSNNAGWDRGEDRRLPDDLQQVLSSRFHLAAGELYRLPTLTKTYHRVCRFYFPVLLLTPLVALVAVVRSRREVQVSLYAWLLVIHATLVVGTIALFAPAPVVRYLHPLVPLFVISLVAIIAGFGRSRLGSVRG